MVIDPADFTLIEAEVELETPTRRRRAKLDGELYVKGPFPLQWVKACQLADQNALFAAFAILMRTHRSILDQEQRWVTASDTAFAAAEFSAYQRRSVIRAMHKAGLIDVERRKGCAPRVRLRPWKEAA